MQANERCPRKSPRMEGEVQQLFPGIPDEITLNKISPKLSWRDFYILAAVSRVWCDAIRSRQVYNARVHCNSTETLVLVNWTPPVLDDDVCNAIGVYSMRDNSLCYLPPIPDVSGGIPVHCQSVSLDGKVYVLGGGIHRSAEVYVLDLAGQTKWKQCAEMGQKTLSAETSDFSRQNYKQAVELIHKTLRFRYSASGCGVIDGKIYAFSRQSQGSEVYDPSKNAWSVISDMLFAQNNSRAGFAYGPLLDLLDVTFAVGDTREQLGTHARFETAGNELVRVPEDDFTNSPHALEVNDSTEEEVADDEVDDFTVEGAKSLEFYNPAQDEWRLVSARCRPASVYFMAQGKLHAMSRKKPFRIHVHNTEENSWRCLGRCSFTGVEPAEYSISFQPFRVLEVGCELLAIIHWHEVPVLFRRINDYWDKYYTRASGYCLARSRGFGSKSHMIVWQRAQTISLSVERALYPETEKFSLYPVQL